MKKWISGILLIGLFAVGNAQIDWATFRGQNARTGVNLNPTGPNPGIPTLRWYFPLQSSQGPLQGSTGRSDIIIDNVDAGYADTPPALWRTPLPSEESPDFYAGNAGGLAIPYRVAFVVPSNAGTGDPTSGATATATWTVPGVVDKLYELQVWFPSSGTFQGNQLTPNSDFAVYKVEYDDNGGTYRSFVDIVPHIGGGGWLRLGDKLTTTHRLFKAGDSGQIRITLYNTVPRDDTDQLMGPTTNRIVAADAVRAIPSPGQIFGSPIVASFGPNAGDVAAYVPRLESTVDPTDPSGTLEISSAKLYSLNAASGGLGTERWSWSANFLANVSLIFDNSNPAFNADAGWTTDTAAPGFFGDDYMSSPVALAPPGTARAVWTPNLVNDGFYDVYAWFPRSGNGELHARGARYVINENGTQTEVFVNQDTQGGGWVRIGGRSFQNDPLNGGLSVEVWNYSNNGGDAGRVVCADAVAFVKDYSAALYSTPAAATINLRLSTGVVAATPVIIQAADDGRIYCLDARGNGAGSTTVYWAYPSIPDTSDPNWTDPNDPIDGPEGNRIPWPSSFGVSSPVVANVGGKDLVFISAKNGRVYAIDAMGRGDYDVATGRPGTAQREWTWPKAKYSQGNNTLTIDPARPAFVGSVAYDASSDQIFVGGTEGRLFALDAGGNGDQTTDNNWAFPDFDENVVGAISSTPAVGGNKVVFTSFDGRVYARPTDGGVAGAWQFPATGSQPLEPFEFTSPAYVTAAQLGNGVGTDLVYTVNDNGNIYALQATDGAVSWQTPEAPGGASSSPSFGHITPPGTGLANTPVITFGSKRGEFLGFYALPGTGPGRENSAGGKLAWGYMSTGTSVFASPAVSYGTDGVRGYLLHAGEDGFLYAFAEGGLVTVDIGFPAPPGGTIGTPDDPGSGDYTNLKLKIISKADYETLRTTPPTGDPSAMADLYNGQPVLEFGERLYLVAYDFELNNPIPMIRFRLSGPGGMSLQYDRPAQPDPTDPDKGFATIAIPINYTGPNFITPGDDLQVDVQAIEQGRIIDPPVAPRTLTVANPLALTSLATYNGTPAPAKSVGWSPNPSFMFLGTFENRINGSNDKRVMSSIGDINHGSGGNTSFWVSDRSRVVDLTSTGITGVRISRTDGFWQGGVAAVRKALPYNPAWEQLPFSFPNLSLDYPDIDRSNLGFMADPNGDAADPLISPVRLKAPSNYDPNNPLNRVLEGVRFGFTMDAPRFQPANLTPFNDASGQNLEGGYVAKTIIYVDSNNNGRPDGHEDTLTDLPPGGRREPYRSLNAGGSVLVDEKMQIEEPTVDLGSEPHSLGYTPMQPWLLNGFIPSIAAGAPYRNFFKPFTLVNEGNVNMLDLRVAKRIAQTPGPNYYPVAFQSDGNDALAWLDGVPNIITNLNPPYAPFNGALDTNGDPRITLHKARPGDRMGTILSVPDVPYGAQPPPNSLPLVGVALPLGFPVGDYSQLVNVVEDSSLRDQAILLAPNGSPLEAYTDPTMRVKFLNRETRLTGGVTSGSVIHVDPNVGSTTNFTYTNTQPSAFRDPGGSVHMVWSANRPGPPNLPAGPQATDDWTLFFSRIAGVVPGGAPSQAGRSPLRDLMGWTGSANNQFWTTPAGPLPADNPNILFGGTPGTIIGQPQYTWPSFPMNPKVSGQANAFEYVFWNGKALKDDSGDGVPDYEDNRIFYAKYFLNPPSVSSSQYLAYDNRMEKKRIRALDIGQTGLAIFWYGETGGVSKMFQNVRERVDPSIAPDQTQSWSHNTLIDPGAGFASARDPQPILRDDGIDLVFTGMLKDRPQPEIFYAKFSASSNGSLRDLRRLPERDREVLARDGTSGVYRARGVNWDMRRSLEVWIRRPNQAPIAILTVNTGDTDESTDVRSYDSELGGKIYLDPNVGTVRMTNAPASNVQVELRYTPRVLRVSELGSAGGHSNPSSFIDLRPQWDRDFCFRNGGNAIGNGDIPLATRLWHVYERGATGPGQTKRPYFKTQRLAVVLNHPVALTNGNLAAPVTVTGMAGAFYQVDPGNGRVYFETPDEGRVVTVTYRYRTSFGGLQVESVQAPVTWQTEMPEKPVPIEQAIDEGTVFAFPDPFVWQPNDPRPGLVWVFFTSTRAGTRDVYYETLAPRLAPVKTP
jgi:outer membrane protein assembly factor BamB